MTLFLYLENTAREVCDSTSKTTKAMDSSMPMADNGTFNGGETQVTTPFLSATRSSVRDSDAFAPFSVAARNDDADRRGLYAPW